MPKKKSSPKKKVKKLLDFFTALQRVVGGKQIMREDWLNEYGYLENGKLMIHRPDGKEYKWLLTDGDLLATDWLIK